MPKVAILGAGNVATAAATFLAERNLADLVLIDVVNYGLAAGKAVDLAAAGPLRGSSARIHATDRIEALAGARVVVNTAGVPRKPGMDRMDLLKTNAAIARRLARGVATHAPDAMVVNVANPLDVICQVFLQTTGFPRERVVGMAGALDSARLRTFIADALDCDPRDVAALVLGGHGDRMVPLVRTATVAGVPVSELLSAEALEHLVRRTRQAGAEVVGLLKTGSAFTSTGAAVCAMVEPLLTGRARMVPASAYLQGEYGLRDLFLGVPVLLGRHGVERIVELALTDAERGALQRSADEVRKGLDALESLNA